MPVRVESALCNTFEGPTFKLLTGGTPSCRCYVRLLCRSVAITMTTKEWIEISIQIASLILTAWACVNSAKHQRAQISAAKAAQEAADNPIIQRWRWFKSRVWGFALMWLLSVGWLVYASAQSEPVTRVTLLQFSLLTMWCLTCAFMVVVFAFVAAFVPLRMIQEVMSG